MALTDVDSIIATVEPLKAFEANNKLNNDKGIHLRYLLFQPEAVALNSEMILTVNERINKSKSINLLKAELLEEKLLRVVELHIEQALNEIEASSAVTGIAYILENRILKSTTPPLTPKEQAVYEIITQWEDIDWSCEDNMRVEFSNELYIGLCQLCTVDWYKKETTMAAMRKSIKRMLKRFKYPDSYAEMAMAVLIRQCEHWE